MRVSFAPIKPRQALPLSNRGTDLKSILFCPYQTAAGEKCSRPIAVGLRALFWGIIYS